MKPTARRLILDAAEANGWTIVDAQYDAQLAVHMYVELRKGIARAAIGFTRGGGVQWCVLKDDRGVVHDPEQAKTEAVLNGLAA